MSAPIKRPPAGIVMCVMPLGKDCRCPMCERNAIKTTTETIVWHAVSDELPDDETTVIGYNEAWDETEDIWMDGGIWRFAASAYSIDRPPTHWAHKPVGPNGGAK